MIFDNVMTAGDYTPGNHMGTTVLKISTEQIPQVKPKIIPAITSVR